MQFGQLLLIQVGLFIHSGLISKLKSVQKERKASETLNLLRAENHRKDSCRFIVWITFIGFVIHAALSLYWRQTNMREVVWFESSLKSFERIRVDHD